MNASSSAAAYHVSIRKIPAQHGDETIFSTLFGGGQHVAWLDSVRPAPGTGRFSYLVQASETHGEVLSYSVRDGFVSVEEVGRGRRRIEGNIFDVLEAEIEGRDVQCEPVPFDFAGGFVGYFGYELKTDCGSHNAHVATTPDAAWLFPDRMAVIDHQECELYLLALSRPSEPGSFDAADTWLAAAQGKLDSLPARPETRRFEPGAAPGFVERDAEAALKRDRDQYLRDIASCRHELLEGESYEICLTNMVHLPPTDPWEFYQSLRHNNPAPYAVYLATEDVSVACSSPERFLHITADGAVETKPIKGTSPRGKDTAEDQWIIEELQTSIKTRAENLMIVDLLRNDLSRVSIPGSVQVSSLMHVETFETLHQLVSTIRSQLRDGITPIDCIRSCFPGGSMTGAPKLHTMEIIDRLETEARGVYSGAIGYVACNGSVDLNIAIRTAVFTAEETLIGAGGAIVADSDALDEFDEMLLKAAATMRAGHAYRGMRDSDELEQSQIPK